MIRFFKRNLTIWIIFYLVFYLWSNGRSDKDPPLFDVFNDLPNNQDDINFIESNPLKPKLNQLTYCAIESAAMANPDKHIRLLVTRHNPLIQRSNFPPFLQNLRSFSVHHIDLEAMINSYFPEFTPEVQAKFHKRVVSLSEISRAVLLFYKGGIYLDQDVVSVGPFANVQPNFLPMSTSHRVATASMKFEQFSPILKLILDLAPSRIDKRDWGNFGPLLFADVMNKYCVPNHYDPTDLSEADFFFQCEPNWKIHIPSVNDCLMIQTLRQIQKVKFKPQKDDFFFDTFALHLNDVNGTADGLKRNNEVSLIMRTYCPQTYADLISQPSSVDD